MFDRRLVANFDWLLLFLIFFVAFEGVFLVYSATYRGTVSSQANPLYLKQIYWVLIGLAAVLVVISIDYHHIGRWSYAFYALNILLLVYLLVKGGDAKVARWFKIGGLSLQPSEFMKLSIILVLGQYFHRNSGPTTIKDVLIPAVIVGIPLVLIVKQPDLGTAITLLPIFFAVLFVAGVRMRYLSGMIGMGLMAAPLLWLKLKPYQKQRIMTFIDPSQDPLGAGYHVTQSKIAVGSGGVLGKGFLAGTQNRLDFLPAQHTDFIFSVLAEEWGFIGAMLTLIVVFFILLKGTDIALHAKDQLGLIFAMGIVTSLAVHVIINVGMVIGLLPVTGLPFPLLSYGGSSTIVTLVSIGILLNIRMRRFTSM